MARCPTATIKRALAIGTIAVATSCATLRAPDVVIAPHPANPVSIWNDVAIETILIAPDPEGTPNERVPDYALDLATLNVALYDAIESIVRTHRPFATPALSDTTGASQEAAATEAAYRVLKTLFPSRSAAYRPTYDAQLASIPDGGAKTRGIAIGAEAARAVLARRENDGRWPPAPAYVPRDAAGAFRGTNPVGQHYPRTKPFSLESAAQFRPSPPPALDSAAARSDIDETRSLGGATSTTRTARQAEIARFYAEPPFRFWPRNMRPFATYSDRLSDDARLMAMLWVAQADAAIGCFEAKYHYDAWRPATAIAFGPNGDRDWKPMLPVPNHPEYPAAHLCVAAAITTVLERFFGTDHVRFTFDSRSPDTSPHTYERTGDLLADVRDARIGAGMHFRSATVAGATLGASVGRWVADRNFQPY